MKVLRALIIGAFLGGIMGWGLGYLRLPYLEEDHAFWVGFTVCMGIVAFGWAIVFQWRKNVAPSRPTAMQEGKRSNMAKRMAWLLLVLFVGLGAFMFSNHYHRKNLLLDAQTTKQKEIIEKQFQLIEQVKSRNMGQLMSNVLQAVEQELQKSDTLSQPTIERIAALSYSLKPYKYLEGDSLSEKPLSPERGQLLLSLLSMEIDSVSMEKIKKETNFAYANLREANLQGKNLSGIQLAYADLYTANLEGAILNKADLRSASLWGANLNGITMKNANAKRADMRWAQINEADLSFSNYSGSLLNNTQFRQTILKSTNFKLAHLTGGLIDGSDLESASLFRTNLTRTKLIKCNFTNAIFRNAIFQNATFSKSILEGVEVSESWHDSLHRWQVIDRSKLFDTYKVIHNSKQDKYYLRYTTKINQQNNL